MTMNYKEAIDQSPHLEIRAANNALYIEARRALVIEGFTFVATIEPVSISQLIVNDAARSLFGYVNPSEEMRRKTPLQMEVAINPNNFRIEDSNNLSTDDQIKKIREQEAILKGKLPEDVRSVISVLTPPKHVSILAQLDFKRQRLTGNVLFTDWSGRADVPTSFPGDIARVGRSDPSRRLDIDGLGRDERDPNTFAILIVVLPQVAT